MTFSKQPVSKRRKRNNVKETGMEVEERNILESPNKKRKTHDEDIQQIDTPIWKKYEKKVDDKETHEKIQKKTDDDEKMVDDKPEKKSNQKKGKNIILNTGGTFSCFQNNDTMKPDPKALKELFDEWVYWNKINEKYEYSKMDPFIDSSNMEPNIFKKIANEVYDLIVKKGAKGIIIIHGTDTLMYTSAMLSLIFENLSTPIIVTGSQYPLSSEDLEKIPDSRTLDRKTSDRKRTDCKIDFDASRNLMGSVHCLNTLGSEGLSGVFCYFNGQLHSGNRVKKKHTSNIDAFESINAHIIAKVSQNTNKISTINFSMWKTLKLLKRNNNKEEKELKVRNIGSRVKLLKLYPGITSDDIIQYCRDYIIILQAFGSGNGPSDLKKKLEENECCVYYTSECYKGTVSSNYETGLETKNSSSCGDMITEVSFVKALIGLGYFENKYSDDCNMSFIKWMKTTSNSWLHDNLDIVLSDYWYCLKAEIAIRMKDKKLNFEFLKNISKHEKLEISEKDDHDVVKNKLNLLKHKATLEDLKNLVKYSYESIDFEKKPWYLLQNLLKSKTQGKHSTDKIKVFHDFCKCLIQENSEGDMLLTHEDFHRYFMAKSFAGEIQNHASLKSTTNAEEFQ